MGGKKLLFCVFCSVFLLFFVVAAPQIGFENPTPNQSKVIYSDFVEVNVSISGGDLDSLIYYWNGTNYTVYDNSLILMMNFDNVTGLGENSTHIFDLSRKGNNGTIVGGTLIGDSGKHGKRLFFDGNNWIC